MSAEALGLSQPRLVARSSLPVAPALRSRHRSAANPGAARERAERAHTMRVNLVCGAIMIGAMLLQVWTGLSVGKLGYELSRAHDLTQRLDRQLNELTLENSGLVKPDALAVEAHKRLGLERPQLGQIVELP
jgi:hypothetical protein